jgi:hypothetical protein
MLDRDERDKLNEIERQIDATDPDLAAVLRDGQRRLSRVGSRTRLLVIIALALLEFGALGLGLGLVAVGVAAVAACWWWLRRRSVNHRGS